MGGGCPAEDKVDMGGKLMLEGVVDRAVGLWGGGQGRRRWDHFRSLPMALATKEAGVALLRKIKLPSMERREGRNTLLDEVSDLRGPAVNQYVQTQRPPGAVSNASSWRDGYAALPAARVMPIRPHGTPDSLERPRAGSPMGPTEDRPLLSLAEIEVGRLARVKAPMPRSVK